MENIKKFEFRLGDLSDEAQAEFIRFLGGDNGNHDVIPFCTYEIVCESGDCDGCGWECTKNDREGEHD